MNIFRTVEGGFRCRICPSYRFPGRGQMISHGRMHVRRGEATEAKRHVFDQQPGMRRATVAKRAPVVPKPLPDPPPEPRRPSVLPPILDFDPIALYQREKARRANFQDPRLLEAKEAFDAAYAEDTAKAKAPSSTGKPRGRPLNMSGRKPKPPATATL